MLDNPANVARFRQAARPQDHPEDWFAARVDAPLLIIPHSNKDAYLDRYALPDKGFTDRSERSPSATATSQHVTCAAGASLRLRRSTAAGGTSRPDERTGTAGCSRRSGRSC